MLKAFKFAVDKATLTERLSEVSAHDPDLPDRIAYMLRVMLCHARGKATDNSLSKIQSIMAARSRPMRECPFIHFRDAIEIIEEDEPHIVTTFFDPSINKAVQLFDDGSTVTANYRKGFNGMVEAYWSDGSTLQLEVPNATLGDDMQPTPYKAR